MVSFDMRARKARKLPCILELCLHGQERGRTGRRFRLSTGTNHRVIQTS